MNLSTKRFVFLKNYLFRSYMFPTCRFCRRTYVAQGHMNAIQTQSRRFIS